MAADGIIPGETVKGGPWARNNESEGGKIIIDWERGKKGTKKSEKKGGVEKRRIGRGERVKKEREEKN